MGVEVKVGSGVKVSVITGSIVILAVVVGSGVKDGWDVTEGTSGVVFPSFTLQEKSASDMKIDQINDIARLDLRNIVSFLMNLFSEYCIILWIEQVFLIFIMLFLVKMR